MPLDSEIVKNILVALFGLVMVFLLTSILRSNEKRRIEDIDSRVRELLTRAKNTRQAGDLPGAEIFYERAIELLSGSASPDQNLLSSALERLAETKDRSGKFGEAKELRSRMLEIWNTALDEGKDDFLVEVDFLCLDAEFGSSTKEVADYYERVLARREKTVAPTSQVFTNTVVIYSRLLRSLGENEIADQLEAHAENLKQ